MEFEVPMSNQSPYILPFSAIGKDDLPLVGGKGANLGEMSRAGFPVPSGFCLTTSAFHAFLAAAKGVSLCIAFQKKIGVGLFGGEGFIMQRLDGDGWVFVQMGGTIVERTLAAGEELHVDTGCLAAYTPGVDFDVIPAGNVKSMFFGGEGVFFARLRGPGKVWSALRWSLQSMKGGDSRQVSRMVPEADRDASTALVTRLMTACSTWSTSAIASQASPTPTSTGWRAATR